MAANEPVADREPDPGSNPSADQRNQSVALIKKLGEFRDGLLVAITVLYVIGYLVWSIHALGNKLGLLPALEPQYLAAGIPVAIILWLAWLGYKLLKRVAGRIQSRLNRLSKRQTLILRGIAVLCIVGCIVLLRVTERYKLTATVSAEQARWLILKDNLVSAAVVVLGLVAVWLFGSKMFAKVLAHFYFFLYLVLVIVIYISWVYPNLPQEFGGVRPRCGYVNVVRDQISEPLQKQILPESTVPSKAAVQRSARLQVFFSGSEFMLVKPDPQNGTAGSGPSLVELKKTAIQAIEWCD